MKSVLTQRKSILVHEPDFFCVVPGFLCCDLFLRPSLVKKKQTNNIYVYIKFRVRKAYYHQTSKRSSTRILQLICHSLHSEQQGRVRAGWLGWLRKQRKMDYRTMNPNLLYQHTTRQPELQSDGAGSHLRCSWVCCLEDGHGVLNMLGIDQRRSKSQEEAFSSKTNSN